MNTKRTNLRCFQLMALAMIWMMAAFLRPVNAEAAYVEDDLIIATASQEGSTVRLTWNAVTDADRYQVYGAEYKDGNSAEVVVDDAGYIQGSSTVRYFNTDQNGNKTGLL